MTQSSNWNPNTYDAPRKRLVPDFDSFYGTAAMIVSNQGIAKPRVLDLGGGTGILSHAIGMRLPNAIFTLFDSSLGMLNVAANRMAEFNFQSVEGSFGEELPVGPFDAIVSALSIHHLENDAKAALFHQVLKHLVSGGVFVNADQIAGPSPWHDALYRRMHEMQSRFLGSDDDEWNSAVERMKLDRYASLDWHFKTFSDAGYVATDCFFQRFGFAVVGGWKRGG